MHLMAEATGVNMDTCPEQVKKVELSDDDRALSDYGKDIQSADAGQRSSVSEE